MELDDRRTAAWKRRELARRAAPKRLRGWPRSSAPSSPNASCSSSIRRVGLLAATSTDATSAIRSCGSILSTTSSSSHGGHGGGSSRRMRSSSAHAGAHIFLSSLSADAAFFDDGNMKRHEGHVDAVASQRLRQLAWVRWLPLQGMHTISSPAAKASRHIGQTSCPSLASRNALLWFRTRRGSMAITCFDAGPPLATASSCTCRRRLMRGRRAPAHIGTTSWSVSTLASTYIHGVRARSEKRNCR
mmetsp:Transcript_23575/g.60259  ORF Transcript_23575/g.60259 Transcript_23575/m.60259 type:complete len:245 (+) Transcript_23575:393-1127(+)